MYNGAQALELKCWHTDFAVLLVRGVANLNATTERTNLQTKRCSKDEAAALRKNHVSRPGRLGATSHYWIERLNTATTCLEPPFTFEMSNTLTSSHRSVPNVLSLRFIASVSKLVPENIPKSVSKRSVRYSHCILLNSKVWLGRLTWLYTTVCPINCLGY